MPPMRGFLLFALVTTSSASSMASMETSSSGCHRVDLTVTSCAGNEAGGPAATGVRAAWLFVLLGDARRLWGRQFVAASWAAGDALLMFGSIPRRRQFRRDLVGELLHDGTPLSIQLTESFVDLVQTPPVFLRRSHDGVIASLWLCGKACVPPFALPSSLGRRMPVGAAPGRREQMPS